MKKIYIYLHIINEKPYVGQTYKPETRFRISSYRHSPKVYNAMKKYKYDFSNTTILLETYSQEEADILEREMIIKYDSINNGYNIQIGGNSGRPQPESVKEKLRACHLGKKLSEEHKQKIREHSRDISGDKNPMKSSEVSEIVRNKNKGKHLSPSTEFPKKKCYCKELDKVFESYSMAGREIGASASCISNVINGRRKTVKGFHFIKVE